MSLVGADLVRREVRARECKREALDAQYATDRKRKQRRLIVTPLDDARGRGRNGNEQRIGQRRHQENSLSHGSSKGSRQFGPIGELESVNCARNGPSVGKGADDAQALLRVRRRARQGSNRVCTCRAKQNGAS